MSEGVLNLMVPRGDKSVWDGPRWCLSTYDRERLAAAAVGSGLAMLGARRGGFAGGLVAMLGSVLAIRSAMGRHDIGVAREWLDRGLKDRGWRHIDMVDEAAADTFPASDAPASTIAD